MSALDDILDDLDDLLHDLGKYIVLPISLLPDTATQDELRSALDTALFRTRRGPTGVQSAESIWTSFCEGSGNLIKEYPGFLGALLYREFCQIT